jgi:predicted metal-dependent hydrolase
MEAVAEYDFRYLAGILSFNRRLFFEAHEIWEDLWHESGPDVRRFYQALIQAAVALHHWNNGNWRGAKRLFHSGRKYMSAYPNGFLGLDVGKFWQQMERAVADVLGESPPAASARLDHSSLPAIEINPPPAQWPELENFLPTT